MLIETKSASLDTMAVTIKALHVSGKQMTLAVFKQLPVANACKESGELEDVERWGLVRYQIKDESALWVVASKDGILYRCDAYMQHAYKVDSAKRRALELQEENKLYARWEAYEISWDAFRKLPNTERDKHRALLPEHINGQPYFKIGQSVEHADELKRAITAFRKVEAIEKSKAILATLPQLFIAV